MAQLFLWGLIGVLFSEYVQLISDRGSFFSSIWGRSTCDSCKKELPWFVLIPFIGPLLSHSRCFFCKKRVSTKYIWFEIIFSLFWIAFLSALYTTTTYDALTYFAAFLCFSISALLVYEDIKNFSVPVSWMGTWVLSVVFLWYQLNFRSYFVGDAALFLVVLLFSLVVVLYIKKLPLKQITDLFGLADIIALLLITFLFGFQAATYILIASVFTSLLYLGTIGKLGKKDVKIPFLAMYLPWIFIAFVLL